MTIAWTGIPIHPIDMRAKKLGANFSRQKDGYIPTLDGWRAVAILGVMFFHGGPLFSGSAPSSPFREMGADGVELFFAISGLLICTRLLEEERAWGAISLRSFYIRRLFRIQPAAFVFLAAVGLLSISRIIHFSTPAWLDSVFSVRNWYRSNDPADGAVYTAHFWSLAIEEHFYLVMPWLLTLGGRHRLRWFGGITLFLILCYEYAARPPVSPSPMRSELEICWLFFPAFLALLVREPRLERRLRSFPPLLVTSAAAALLFFAVAEQWKFSRLFWLPCLSLLVMATMRHPNSLLGRFLEITPMRVIGRISYSLYLWQQLFCISRVEFPAPRQPLAWMQGHPQSYLFTFAFAAASYYLIEKPSIRIGHRLAPPVSAGHADLAVPSGGLSPSPGEGSY